VNLGDLVWGLVVKGSIVVVIATIAGILLRRTSSARRHLVWLAALCGLLLLPLTAIRLPAWTVSEEAVPVVAPLVIPAPIRPARVEVAEPMPVIGQPIDFQPKPKSPDPIDWAKILGRTWLAGFGLALLYELIGLAKVWGLIRKSRPWPHRGMVVPSWATGIRVVVCPGLKLPATAGLLRPVILLPVEAPDWTTERLKMVLAHEAAHVKRRDWAWQVLAQLACAMHFFNPLAWIAARRLRIESEHACDDFVLQVGIEPASYAQELLNIAQGVRFSLHGAVGIASSGNLESRLRSIVARDRNRKSISGQTMVWVLAAGLVVALPLGLVHARAAGRFHRQAEHYASKIKLPQIPWVASKEEEPNVYLAENGVGGLPNGIRVRLIGISPSDQGDDSWEIDGTHRSDSDMWQVGAPYFQGRTFHMEVGAPSVGPIYRSFLVELESPKDDTVATTSQLTVPKPVVTRSRVPYELPPGGDCQIPSVELDSDKPTYAIIPIAAPSRDTRGDYHFGVASFGWKTIFGLDHPFGDMPDLAPKNSTEVIAGGMKLDMSPSLYWFDSRRHRHEISLHLDQPLALNEAHRARIYDANDEELDLPTDLGYANDDGSWSYRLPIDVMRKIARLEIQSAPFQWVDFPNVPLKPNYEKEMARRLDPGIQGTATGVAPGFTRALPGGVSVSVLGVTRPVLDGDQWRFDGQPTWRADGHVLAKTPWRLSSWPLAKRIYGSREIVKYQVDYHGLGRDDDVWLLPTGPVEPGFDWWMAPHPGIREADIPTAYPQGTSHGGLKVGIARGPWQTVSTTPINVAEKPPLTGAQVDNVRAILDGPKIRLGDKPELDNPDEENPRQLSKRPITGMDRRVLVVLKSGKEQQLTNWSSGLHGVQTFTLATRRGSWDGEANGVLASDVKAIELQVRPFQWVEFNGIALNPTR